MHALLSLRMVLLRRAFSEEEWYSNNLKNVVWKDKKYAHICFKNKNLFIIFRQKLYGY